MIKLISCVHRYLPVCAALVVLGACSSGIDPQHSSLMDKLAIADKTCSVNGIGYMNEDFDPTGRSKSGAEKYFKCIENIIPESTQAMSMMKLEWINVLDGKQDPQEAHDIWVKMVKDSAEEERHARNKKNWDDLVNMAFQYNAAHPTTNCSSIGQMPGTMTCN